MVLWKLYLLQRVQTHHVMQVAIAFSW